MNNLRTDLIIDNIDKYKLIKKYKNIEVLESIVNKYIYRTIKFNNVENKNSIIKVLKKEIKYFLSLIDSDINHILFVGLGNEENTADSIGPKTIKKIKVNFDKKVLKVSAFIPGVMGITGIKTDKLVSSVVDNIKPNLIVIIDSIVTNNIDYINKTIEITNSGIKPGSGLMGLNKEINESTLKIPIITIGIPDSLEYLYKGFPFLLSSSNIDYFVNNVSDIISSAINDIIYKELNDTPL